MRVRVLLFALLFSCAGSTPRGDDGTAAPEAGESTDTTYRPMYRPDQIYAILEASKVSYEVDGDSRLRRIDLTEVVDGPLSPAEPLSSFLELRRDAKDRPRLTISNPPPEIAELHDQGFVAFSQRRFDDARDFYAIAAAIRPDYFKTFTYLGNSFFFLGELERAEDALRKAIELNPLDYQAHLFLGNTLYRAGRLDEAKRRLLTAYMLNRANPTIEKHLQAVLSELSLKIRSNRISPRARIERIGQGKVRLRFDKNDGLRWFPLVNCLACWEFEEACRTGAPETELPIRVGMYRECLLNQAMGIAVRTEKEERVTSAEHALLDAIHGGYLDAIIFWEIVAPRIPVIILLLTSEQQTRILEYIDKFVLAPSQTA